MNRLAQEPSAYLRQHAQNPVDWQPFDSAAFAEALERDVPIFLSVGYAACHWCHVMAGESFEDPAIGAYLNQNFVAIKVDREERPDVDDAYMAATQALSGEGGWPMSVFLTPTGQAFYAGTYFPPKPLVGRPSFQEVLEAVHEAWTERRAEVQETADSLGQALAQPLWAVRASAVELTTPATEDWSAVGRTAVLALAREEDADFGGFGTAPKFPPTPTLEFLLRQAAIDSSESGKEAFRLAGRTLGSMVHSALFDQLGGGFSRYSVTADWSEPHYEKMLYDNAGLLRVLVHWIRLADSPSALASPEEMDSLAMLSVADARECVASTIEWLLAELQLPSGAFASSLDADTIIDGSHHEGASYRWTFAELGQAAQRTITLEQSLNTANSLSGVELLAANDQVANDQEAAELATTVANAMFPAQDLTAGRAPYDAQTAFPFHPRQVLRGHALSSWQRIKPALLSLRAERVMPARDEKVVASWNAMLMAALAEAGRVLEEPAYVSAAVVLGEYLHTVHWDGELSRVSHEGQARGIKGLLEDYAGCANGFLTLYAATGERKWFDFAGQLVEALERDFIADGLVINRSGTSLNQAPQGSNFADPFDNASASGVSMMAEAFIAWAAYTGSSWHRELAQNLLAAAPELARQAPRSAGGLLGAALALAAGPLEVAIVGPAGTQRTALVRQAWLSASPGMVIAVGDGAEEPAVPLLQGRSGVEPLAYVCKNMVCARPVSTVDELRQLLL